MSTYYYHFVVSKTTDAGATWHRDTLLTSTNYMLGNSMAVQPAASNLVYAAGYNSLFFKSTNAGSSWTLLNTGLTSAYYIYDIAPNPANPSIIYLATYYGVYKTTNGGTNWAASGLTSYTVNDVLIHPRGPDTLYAGTSSGFYKSTNAGGTWTAINGGLIDTYVTKLAINPGGSLRSDSSFIFAATQGGGMHRMFLMLIPIAEQKTETAHICFAISPNPVRARARFQYTLDHASRVEMRIYDTQGRLVQTLVESQKNAGTYYTDWDCHAQAAGIYFVKMVSDKVNEVHKMILVD